MDGCKKKLDTELEINFTGYFGQNVNYIERIRELEELKIRKHFGEDIDDLLLAIEDYLLEMMAPKIFNPFDENCVLIENDRLNEDLINAIEESGITVKYCTVFEFYNKISYLEKRAKQLKERRK